MTSPAYGMRPFTFTHHVSGSLVVECTCGWVSEPTSRADAPKVGTDHVKEWHP